jgi:hypothetical protein
LEASRISFMRRSDIVFSRRARAKLTSQRIARVVARFGLTSIGTW